MNFIAIDFETANEKRASACSLGMTIVKNGQVVDELYYLIKPKELRFSPMNTWIHGLRAHDVKNAKEFDALWPELEPYFRNNFVIAHNASFDMSVLRATLDAYNLPYPSFDYGCTMLLAKNFFPMLENAKLNTVNHYLGLEFNHHHAGADAFACANILLKVKDELNSLTIHDVFDQVGIKHGKVYDKGYQAPKKGHLTLTSNRQFQRTTSPLFNSQTDFFNHKTVVFTGPLQSLSRTEAIALIGQLGGTVGSSVTKKTNIIVTGIKNIYELSPDEMSTKLKKAIQLVYHGQEILFLNEDEFLKILTSS